MSLVTYAFKIPQKLKDSLSGFEDQHGITAPGMLRLALFQMANGSLTLDFTPEEKERARGKRGRPGRRKRSSKRAEQLHADLREIWAAVSEQPGVTYAELSEKVGFSKTKVHRLVGLLLDSGTLVSAKGEGKYKERTLQASVPMITMQT